jgi:hypothetical protein
MQAVRNAGERPLHDEGTQKLKMRTMKELQEGAKMQEGAKCGDVLERLAGGGQITQAAAV